MAERDTDLYAGLTRLHVLHHAAWRPICGLWMIEELARHGYRLSRGTLYPLLHGLEAKGYLCSAASRTSEGRIRRLYRITPAGRRAFAAAKRKVGELFGAIRVPPVAEGHVKTATSAFGGVLALCFRDRRRRVSWRCGAPL